MSLQWQIMTAPPGTAQVPEGFPSVLAQLVNTSGPLGTFSYQLDPDYWFFLDVILSKWAVPTSAASVPRVSLFRERGNRSYWDPVDLQLIGTPGIAFTSGVKGGRLNGFAQLGIYFPPGSALQMRITGQVANDPAYVKLAALGRYVFSPEGVDLANAG